MRVTLWSGTTFEKTFEASALSPSTGRGVFEKQFEDAAPEFERLVVYELDVPAEHSVAPEVVAALDETAPKTALDETAPKRPVQTAPAVVVDPSAQVFVIGQRVMLCDKDGNVQKGVVGTVLAVKGPKKNNYEVDFGPAMMTGRPNKRKHKKFYNNMFRPADPPPAAAAAEEEAAGGSSPVPEAAPEPEPEPEPKASQKQQKKKSRGGKGGKSGGGGAVDLFAGSPEPFADLMSPSSAAPEPEKAATKQRGGGAVDLFATDAENDAGGGGGATLSVRKTPLFASFVDQTHHFTKTGSGQT
eukprot:COSAG06_NODE_2962_length_6022_cov_28.844816_8_plen_300_part_00